MEGLRLAVHADQVGSIRLLSLPDGSVLKRLEYDAFGNILEESPRELFFPLGFAGGLRDPFTSLTRFGYRDYDPETGRFMAKDPIGDTGGDHDLYDYCVDDPVTMNDPSGLKGKDIAEENHSPFQPWWTLPPTDKEHQKRRQQFLTGMYKACGGNATYAEGDFWATVGNALRGMATLDAGESAAIGKSSREFGEGMLNYHLTWNNPAYKGFALALPEISAEYQARKRMKKE